MLETERNRNIMSEDTSTTTTSQAPADLDQLWRRFSSDLRAFIARRVSRPEDADDILSIVFLRMAKSLDNLREQDRLLGWMYAITRNAITDYYRSAPHRRELAVDAVPDNPLGGEADPDEAAAKELASCLVPMLSGLPAEQAAAVKMVDLDARTHAAAASEAGISVSGMKSWCSAAVPLFRLGCTLAVRSARIAPVTCTTISRAAAELVPAEPRHRTISRPATQWGDAGHPRITTHRRRCGASPLSLAPHRRVDWSRAIGSRIRRRPSPPDHSTSTSRSDRSRWSAVRCCSTSVRQPGMVRPSDPSSGSRTRWCPSW